MASSRGSGPRPPGDRDDDHPERLYSRSVGLGRRGDPLWSHTLVADCPATCPPSDSTKLRSVRKSDPPGVRTLLDARPHRPLSEIRRPGRRARCVLGRAVVRDPGPRGHIGAHPLTADRPFIDRPVLIASLPTDGVLAGRRGVLTSESHLERSVLAVGIPPCLAILSVDCLTAPFIPPPRPRPVPHTQLLASPPGWRILPLEPARQTRR